MNSRTTDSAKRGPIPGLPRSRWGVLVCEAALVLYFAFIAIAAAISDRPPTHMWRSLGVLSYERPFYDLGVVVAGIETAQAGLSPYESVNRPPLYATFNYPRIWMGWRWLGLSQETLWFWGIVVALAFWASSLLVLRPQTIGHGLTIGALWCSPAFMLGVERGNVDLVVFAVVALSLVVRRWSELASLAGILVAGVAKLFPIAAAVALARGRTGLRWSHIAGVLAGFAAYLWLIRGELQFILNIHPRGTALNYGCATPFQLLGLPYPQAYAWGLATSAALAAAAIALLPRLPELPEPQRAGLLAGTAIYCGTYLIGSNYEYRLVWLQLTLPALWFWGRHEQRHVRRFAQVCFATVLMACWWSFIRRHIPGGTDMPRHLATLLTFALLAPAGLSSITDRNFGLGTKETI